MNHDATPSITGYEYQLLRALDYLLADIDRDSTFYVRIEGDNDVCASGENEIILEQDKQSSRKFTLNSDAIKNSICIFIDNWLKYSSSDKDKLKFVFVTNADYGKEQKRGAIAYPENAVFSYLTSNNNFYKNWEVVKTVLVDTTYRFYENDYSPSESANKSIVAIWNEVDWKEFFSHIEWHFGTENRDELETKLKQKINKICNQYDVRVDLGDFLLAKVKDDILSGCSKDNFTDKIVTVEKVKNYILQLAWTDSNFKFCLNNMWFQQMLDRTIKLLGDSYSREKNYNLYDDSYLDQLGDVSKGHASYLFYGKAGMGKSHFLAHSAEKYMQKGGNVILVLGQRCLGNQSIEQKILSFIELDIKLSFNDLLCQLNELGKSTNKRSIIFYDSFNESKIDEEAIQALISRLKEFPYVGFVGTIRKDALYDTKYGEIFELRCLKGVQTKNELKTFMELFGVPAATNFYSYLLGQPLLLIKNFCEVYYSGQYKVEEPLYKIFDLYFKNVNANIRKIVHGRYHVDVVMIALNAFCDLLIKNYSQESRFVDYQELCKLCKERTDEFYIGFNIVDVLIEYNIFAEQFVNESKIFIEFELWKEYLVIKRILENENVKDFTSIHQFHNFFNKEKSIYPIIRDMDEMLAILLPDIKCKYKKGGFEAYYWPNISFTTKKELFLYGLYWRDVEKIPQVAYSSYINDIDVQMSGSDILYDMWKCVLQQCLRGNGKFGVQFLKNMNDQLCNSAFLEAWGSYLNEEFYKSEIYHNLKHAMGTQRELLSPLQRENLLFVFTYFLYSVNSNIVHESMLLLAEMMIEIEKKQESRDWLYNYIFEVWQWSKDIQVFIYLIQIIYNISDQLSLETIHKVCCFLSFLSVEAQDEIFYNEYYWFKVFFNGLAEKCFIEKEGMYYGKDFKWVNRDTLLSEANQLYRTQCKEDDEGVYILEMRDYECGEEFYLCQNRIIDMLLDKEHHYDLISEYCIDVLPETDKDSFLYNVMRTIFEQGYVYARFGSVDLFADDSNTYAARYEKLALNRVMQSYLCAKGEKEQFFYPLLNCFTIIDCSIPIKAREISCKRMDVSDIQKNIIRELDYKTEWITFIGSDCYQKLTVDIYKKETEIPMQDVERDGDTVELLFYHELYDSSRQRYIMKEQKEKNSLWFQFLWDYIPFLTVSLLGDFWMKEYSLSYCKETFSYYRDGNIVCKNTLLENGMDILVMHRDFLAEICEKYHIIWRCGDWKRIE